MQPAQMQPLLNTLAALLLRPCLTMHVARIFRPLLLDLAARWLLSLRASASPSATAPAPSAAPSLQALQLALLAPCPVHGHLPHARHQVGPRTNSPKHSRDGEPILSADASMARLSERLALAFGRLLPIAPQLRSHAICAFTFAPSPLAAVPSLLAIQQQPSADLTMRLTGIVGSVFRLVDFARDVFASLWNPQPLYALLTYPDATIRAYAAYTLSLLVGMSDSERQQLLALHIPRDANADVATAAQKEQHVEEAYRVALLRLVEQTESESEHAKLFEQLPLDASNTGSLVATAACLSSLTVDMCSILLPHNDLTSITAGSDVTANIGSAAAASSADHRLVLTPSTAANLRRMGLAISLGLPILLEGAPGVGKTALVEEASRIVGAPDLLKIHLGDQTDSKLLLGTYMTTSTPGSFKWQPGVLTTAVSEGKWILIEDIDLAPVDVVAVLVPLLETRWLHIASRGERIRAKNSFRIFATRRVAAGTDAAARRAATSFGQRHLGESLWSVLDVAELAEGEVRQVLHSRFPSLDTHVGEIMASFAALRSHFQETHAVGRSLSLRDLIKWCQRVSSLHLRSVPASSAAAAAAAAAGGAASQAQVSVGLQERQREGLFREALDCFISMIPKKETRQQLALRLGETLQILQHRVEFYLDHDVPKIESSASADAVAGSAAANAGRLACGRVSLPIFDARIANARRAPFATTSPSLRLLERIAVSASLYEPVLLVGETGTGKTTVVQHLASLTGTKLVVINMSQQSDSTDLLGGFKPVDALLLAAKVKEDFDELFARTFSVKTNGPFIESVLKAYARRNWSQLMVGFRNAIKMARKTFEKKRLDAEQDARDADGDVAMASASASGSAAAAGGGGVVAKKKKRRVADPKLVLEWTQFEFAVNQFAAQLEQIKNNFLFSFVEGSLVKALKHGHWILLDEVNLASAETLECLSGLLQSADGSVLLLERGDTAPVKRHPNFRLFACMNPANDAGKRDLPPGLRSRFTEFWVDAPDAVTSDLHLIIRSYIFGHLPPGQEGNDVCEDIASFYLTTKNSAIKGELSDGADQRVHFSMRTLTRALSYAMHIAPVYGLKRSLYEGMYMTFLTGLSAESSRKTLALLKSHIFRKVPNFESSLRQTPPNPGKMDDRADLKEDVARDSNFTLVNCFWIENGPLPIPADLASTFVLTASVKTNLANLGRAVLSRKYPVLIQGPTSAGKTSMVEYLAKLTGHRFLRINNHEHTDIQEYLGGYVSNDQGALVFRDGVLVEALRKGYWIVLDELNLAPSDVLEALNRLLDDNRELFLPETQETIRPHPHFMLFATQNPAGQYGGRKQLSRAFRNRFLELHFSDIPETELETILERRCRIAPSYAAKLVAVYKGLQKSRDTSRIFDGRASFVTLRDLFRWALRGADSYQRLAEDGFMLLAERVRKVEDRRIIRGILEKEMRVRLDEDVFYETLFEQYSTSLDLHGAAAASPELARLLRGVVWTKAMRRLFVLVYSCVLHSEPVLLVGETGCGKTTVCQILAALLARRLHIVNAHQNSETADFLGSQRPVRGRDQAEAEFREHVRSLFGGVGRPLSDTEAADAKLGDLLDRVESLSSSLASLDLAAAGTTAGQVQAGIDACLRLGHKSRALFAWVDGPLVQAMRQGDLFLLDEISLADDSVLERLNSVLEPQRLLVLAENGASGQVEEIYAAQGFEMFATMNPGGDYGKKELSPALRNRFTELWVPSVSSREDLLLILAKKLEAVDAIDESARSLWAGRVLDFLYWLADELHKPIDGIVSLRDILAWVGFLCTTSPAIGVRDAFFHGGCMVVVDGMSINPLFGVGNSAEALARRSKVLLRRLADMPATETGPFAVLDLAAWAGASGDAVEDVPEFGVDGEASDLAVRGAVFGSSLFHIPMGPSAPKAVSFALQAPTTRSNGLRILRALQLSKPILLEGSPGVGKTSLVASLAAVSGHSLVRINLSEQTDLMDLFGSDLPVEGGSGGEFAWRDGPFLKAMQDGDWVLLDELNLASQQVLEGLNACLDHRATIYIPELDRSVPCHPDFRVFAAQNPQHEGGGRKGLPKSFVNRFSQVYVSALSHSDLRFITSSLYPRLDAGLCDRMIAFNETIRVETTIKCSFGWRGAPWEFNLRDVLRWIDLWQTSVGKADAEGSAGPGDFLEMLYVQRMRTQADRERVRSIFLSIFGYLPDRSRNRPNVRLTPTHLLVGDAVLERMDRRRTHKYGVPTDTLQVLPSALPFLESLVQCIGTRTLPLLIGPSASGKSSLVRLLASMAGQTLHEFSLNPGVDALELLGGFEQVDLTRRSQEIADAAESLLHAITAQGLLRPTVIAPAALAELQTAWMSFSSARQAVLKQQQHHEQLQQLQQQSQQLVFAALDTLLGGLEQVAVLLGTSTAEIDRLRSELVSFKRLVDVGVRGQFEWMDSALVHALERGDWTLIDNVNLCSASVLDRLNPLVEVNGSVAINERGLVDGEIKVITPHPDFRLFMAMDPVFGEVSRAMRNRAVEICIDGFEDRGDPARMLSVAKLATAAGLPGTTLAAGLAPLSAGTGDGDAGAVVVDHGLDARIPFVSAQMIVEQLQRGVDLDAAVTYTLDPETAEAVVASLAAGNTATNPLATVWPQFVSGKLAVQDASLASLMASASAVVATTAPTSLDSPRFFSAVAGLAAVADRPPRLDLVRAALDVFLQATAPGDGSSRAQWLSLWIDTLGSTADAATLSALRQYRLLALSEQTPLVEACTAQTATNLARAGVAGAVVQHFPIDARLAGLPRLARLAGPASKALASLVALETALRAAEATENAAFTRAERMRSKDMSIAQLSFAFNHQHIAITSLPHPCVAAIYPLLSAVKTVMLRALSDPSRVGDEPVVVSWMRSLHAVAICGKPRTSATSTCPSWCSVLFGSPAASGILAALLAGHDQDAASIQQAVQDASDALGLEKIKAVSGLWKVGSITTLRNPVLVSLAARFGQVDAALNSQAQSPGEWIMRRSVTADGFDIKTSVVEGVATLYYLNEESEPSDELIRVLESVPLHLDENIAKIDKTQTLPLSIAALSGINAQLASVSLWPLHDTWALAAEQVLLCKLSQLLSGSDANSGTGLVSNTAQSRRLADEVRSFLDNAVTTSSFAPLHFEPLQRLAWFLKGTDHHRGAAAVSDQSRRQLVHTIVQEATYQWNRAFWANGFGFWRWRQHREDESEMFMMRGQVAELLALEEEHASGDKPALNNSAGSSAVHVPLHDGLSRHCLALIESLHKVPVYAGESKVMQMRTLLSHASSPDFEVALDTHKLDARLLAGSLHQFFAVHAEHYTPDDLAAINDHISAFFGHEASHGIAAIASQLQTLMRKATSARFLAIVESYLVLLVDSTVQAFAHYQASNSDDASGLFLGPAWTLYALAFLDVYIPDLPVDPVAMRSAKLALAGRETDRLKADILVHAELEFVSTGNSAPSPSIAHKLDTLDAAFSKMAKWRARLPARPPKSQMADIVQELQQVKRNVLRIDSVTDLLAKLTRPSSGRGPSAQTLDQEQSLQDVLQSAIDRMEAKYTLYRDLLQPACTAIYQLKYGVRLARHTGMAAHRRNVAPFVGPLVQFVQGFDTDTMDAVLEHVAAVQMSDVSSMQTKLKVQLALVDQVSALFAAGITIDVNVMRRVHALFDAIVGVWSDAEDQRIRDEQAKESLYTMQKTVFETDDDVDEADFKARFPDYFETFEDLAPADALADDDDAETLAKKKKEQDAALKHAPTFDESQALRIAKGHRAVVAAMIAPTRVAATPATQQTAQALFAKQWGSAFMSSLDAAVAVCRMEDITVPKELDQAARLGLAYAAGSHLDQFVSTSVSNSDTYDFYNDANVQEAQHIQPLLARFEARINELLQQWPDHDVLVQLRIVARRIASFPIVSPLMKLLTGLELLLVKSQDWEAYASREVSIKPRIDEIVTMIVKWRRLELETWRQLLNLEEHRCAAKAYSLWFHLWRTILGIVRSPTVNATKTEAGHDSLLEGLFTTLDNLCITSPIGQFAERLDMLRSFHSHLAFWRRMVSDTVSYPNLNSVIDLLWNVISYYSQFTPSVTAAIDKARAPILKELRGYVKIATWKDINVFALKESAKRTHHHLNKFVKKYKVGLEAPIKEIIAAFQETPPAMPGSAVNPETLWDHAQASALAQCQTRFKMPETLPELALTAQVSADQPVGRRLADAGRLLSRMKKLTASVVGEGVFAAAAIGLDDLAGTVLSRVQDFRNMNSAIVADPKTGKGQKQLRKKAVVDLLKHLALLGLSPRCRQRYTGQQDSYVINMQPELDTKALVETSAVLASSEWMDVELRQLASRSHAYHFRNLARVATVRAATLTVAPDLTLNEVDRAASSLEHLMHLTLEQREQLAAFAAQLSQSQGFMIQLQRVTADASRARLQPAGAFVERLEQAKRVLDTATTAVSQSLTVASLAAVHGRQTSVEFRQGLDLVSASLAEVKAAVDVSYQLYALSAMHPPLVACGDDKQEIATSYTAIFAALTSASTDLTELAAQHPEDAVFVREAAQMLAAGIAALPQCGAGQPEPADAMDAEKASMDAVVNKMDAVVERLLVAFQHLRTPAPDALVSQKPSAQQPDADGDAEVRDGDAETDKENQLDEFGLQPNHIIAVQTLWTTVFEPKHLVHLLASIRDLLATVESFLSSAAASGDASSTIAALLAHLTPLFNQYFALARFRLVEHFSYSKSMSKLTYVLANLFASLFKEGFCLPNTDDNGGEEGDKGDQRMEDDVNGMGIGEGEGKKDVSDEIENEEQVEGLQEQAGKKQPPPPPDPNKHLEEEDHGIEMSNDFDGVLEEVDGDDEEEDDKEDDDEDKRDEDEQMGDVDKDLADVVDEKLWDEDDEEQGGGEQADEKTERNAGVDAGDRETETVAKDEAGQDEKGDQDDKKKKKKEKEAQQDESANKQDEDQADADDKGDGGSDQNDDDQEDAANEPERVNEDKPDKFEDSHGIDVKDADDLDPGDDEEQEDDAADEDALPDDMDLDGDDADKDGKDDEMDVDEDKGQKDDQDDGGDEGDGDEKAKAQDLDMMDHTDDGDAEEQADPEANPDQVVDEEEKGEEDEEEEEEKVNEQKEDDEAEYGGTEAKEAEGTAMDRAEQEMQQQQSSQPFGVQGAQGREAVQANDDDAEGQDQTQADGDDGQARMTEDAHGDDSKTRQSNSKKPQGEQQQQQQKRDQLDTNPRRNVGDAMKEWLSRLKRIADKSNEAEQEREQQEHPEDPSPDAAGDDQFEFVENDDTSANAQALGAATDEQLEQMDRQALADEEKEGNYQEDNAMDVDESKDKEGADQLNEPEDTARDRKGAAASLSLRQQQSAGDSDDDEDAEDTDGNNGKGQETAEEKRRRLHQKDEKADKDSKTPALVDPQGPGSRARQDQSDDDDEDMVDTIVPPGEEALDYAALRRDLDERMALWRQAGGPAAEGEQQVQNLWRSYVDLTRDLAFNLCEQLRLILEPTLATKLKGDYRTGKRLNMRKVISYVASQFKKDKIWLRRTKPSKRTYQIMVAVDDSRSMSESGSVRLAFESLAMISKALTQLEVGEVGIVRFGESVQLVHPFERTFTDEAGADLIRNFTFEQDRTNVKLMMETAMNILEHSRATQASTATDLWQLQLVISDGVCEDHADVRAMVRKAAESRIMVVFIVLDNRLEKNSILNMTNVSYEIDPKTQRSALKLTRYMDTFPFDYYVVVRDIERLPEVLAETLRQFFMFVSG
ncbi:hypothetical protein BC831DRAFT_533163 [Entophlyctis helioformis]|nr:hypothetical protein BC831DRAFT_533163 [Entophlyctis helioformis]